MKASKTAIAVALSSVFLFGCDFDVGSENKATGPGDNPGGSNPGGGETTPGVNYFAQILDSTEKGTGQLRLKLSESKSETAVSEISAGFLTVDLTYQKTASLMKLTQQKMLTFNCTQQPGQAPKTCEVS